VVLSFNHKPFYNAKTVPGTQERRRKSTDICKDILHSLPVKVCDYSFPQVIASLIYGDSEMRAMDSSRVKQSSGRVVTIFRECLIVHVVLSQNSLQIAMQLQQEKSSSATQFNYTSCYDL